MTALTTGRATPRRAGQSLSDPLAALAVIFAGAMYALDAAGNAVTATSAGLVVRGVAEENANQAQGDTNVKGSVGIYRFGNDTTGPFTRADIGAVANVLDDQTVTRSPGAVAGKVFDIDDLSGEVWVHIG